MTKMDEYEIYITQWGRSEGSIAVPEGFVPIGWRDARSTSIDAPQVEGEVIFARLLNKGQPASKSDG